MNKQIVVPNVYDFPPDKFFDGSQYLPKEIGNLKLLRKECRNQIIYSCGGFNTPTLCVEIKGIESDCNTL